MGESFKGWRRKAGVVTLVVSCIVMGGRFRSSTIQDTITIGSASSFQVRLISASHRFVIAKLRTEGDEYPWAPLWDSQAAREKTWELNFRFRESVTPTISSPLTGDLCTFGTGPVMRSDRARCEVAFCQFPYWTIVCPLTFLSAYLLLWKPRKRTSGGLAVLEAATKPEGGHSLAASGQAVPAADNS